MDTDPLQIYKAWPEDMVRQALDDFKYQMYDDADQDALRAGIRCFDFITRRSDLPQSLMESIEYVMMEARWRITLMDEYDAQQQVDAEGEEALTKAIQVVEHLRTVARYCVSHALSHLPQDADQYIRNRIRSRTV